VRVLIAEQSLGERRGPQLFTRDVALGLLRRGHSPIVYSTALGEIAGELRDLTIPVVDDLEAIGAPPDVIHGHRHIDTLSALLHFRGVPGVVFCHSPYEWELFLVLPSVMRYVAVDSACLDRMLYGFGVPEERARTLLNFVDLERFRPRAPLPRAPQRALVFGHYARENPAVAAVQEACARAGIELDLVGGGASAPTREPERLLPGYDLVFSRGRAAIEAMAVGAAVVPMTRRLGPLVTTENFDRLRPLNFGVRATDQPPSAGFCAEQIARYDPADAAEVSRRIRSQAGVESALDELLAIYGEAIEEYARKPPDEHAELRAAARYLRIVSVRLHSDFRIRAERNRLRAKLEELRAQRRVAAPLRWLRRLAGRS